MLCGCRNNGVKCSEFCECTECKNGDRGCRPSEAKMDTVKMKMNTILKIENNYIQ